MLTKIVFSLILIFVFAVSLRAFSVESGDVEPKNSEQDVFNLEPLLPFNGKTVSKIEINGLRRTRLFAISALLTQNEGESFDAKTWLIGLHKIYDTTVVFDLHTHARLDDAPSDGVILTIDLTDRWTLIPFAVAQTGGGSTSLIFGLEEANFLGRFAQVSFAYGIFNNTPSYDFNVFDEFLGHEDLITGLDLSQIGLPMQLQNNDGAVVGHSTRFRTQEQILIGRKWTAQRVRLLAYLESFEDRFSGDTLGPSEKLTEGRQYRVRPSLIWGRAELTNFLEEGREITVSPVFSNPFGANAAYTQLVASWKRVFLRKDTNYAVFVSAGAMTPAEIPYQFHLGGYDTVRGFSTFRAIGLDYATTVLEYRPYLLRFRFPIGLFGDVVTQGCVFNDEGYMLGANKFTPSDPYQNLWLSSFGAGLRFHFLNFAGGILRLDAARTIHPDEGWDFSFGLGQFF